MVANEKFTGEIVEIIGYPLDRLVQLLPLGVTQVAARLRHNNREDADEWVVSYVVKFVPTTEGSPLKLV